MSQVDIHARSPLHTVLGEVLHATGLVRRSHASLQSQNRSMPKSGGNGCGSDKLSSDLLAGTQPTDRLKRSEEMCWKLPVNSSDRSHYIHTRLKFHLREMSTRGSIDIHNNDGEYHIRLRLAITQPKTKRPDPTTVAVLNGRMLSLSNGSSAAADGRCRMAHNASASSLDLRNEQANFVNTTETRYSPLPNAVEKTVGS